MKKEEGRRKKEEGRRQKAGGRRQEAEGRRQKAEGRSRARCPHYEHLIVNICTLYTWNMLYLPCSLFSGDI
ncbi:hypothetical protein [Okeania sp. KiyG1]|uniref:hypothetical protein n=1 Tax=Okeania sp. KiyG1 TaxID=2720165 RepID=UPI0019233589|nr:hypothetical protein [Okeania sp. KiyG1]